MLQTVQMPGLWLLYMVVYTSEKNVWSNSKVGHIPHFVFVPVCRTRPKSLFGCTHIVLQTVQRTGVWSATYGTVRYRNIQKSRSYSRLRVYFCGDIAVQKHCSKLFKGLVHKVLSMVLYKYKNTFWRHSKRVGHNPNFGLLSVAILWQCTDSDANQ